MTLAFLGDAVYEQLVRERLVLHANAPAGKLHEHKIKKVCAAYQSKAMNTVEGLLLEDELSVYKRGRNATGNAVPKSSNTTDYRRATGLESLFGYLHLLGNTDRIYELFEIIWNIEEQED